MSKNKDQKSTPLRVAINELLCVADDVPVPYVHVARWTDDDKEELKSKYGHTVNFHDAPLDQMSRLIENKNVDGTDSIIDKHVEGILNPNRYKKSRMYYIPHGEMRAFMLADPDTHIRDVWMIEESEDDNRSTLVQVPVGANILRTSYDIVKKLGIDDGDPVLVTGAKQTVATCISHFVYNGELPETVINQGLRFNGVIDNGDLVEVVPVKTTNALKITLKILETVTTPCKPDMFIIHPTKLTSDESGRTMDSSFMSMSKKMFEYCIGYYLTSGMHFSTWDENTKFLFKVIDVELDNQDSNKKESTDLIIGTVTDRTRFVVNC